MTSVATWLNTLLNTMADGTRLTSSRNATTMFMGYIIVLTAGMYEVACDWTILGVVFVVT